MGIIVYVSNKPFVSDFNALQLELHHRGEIAAGWVCGSGLRSFRTRAKVFSDAG